MQPTTVPVTEPALTALVEQARNRYGRAGLVALVELCRQELIGPNPWTEKSLVGP